MSPELIVSITTLVVDIGILVILIMEYNYDRIAYERQKYKKRKPKPTFEHLTDGEMK